MARFNASHRINSLTFGTEFEGQKNPLSGQVSALGHERHVLACETFECRPVEVGHVERGGYE